MSISRLSLAGWSLVCALTLVLGRSAVRAEEPAAKPIQEGTPHPFACSDYSQGKIFFVNKEGKVEWDYPAPACNDLWVLPNGNILFVAGTAVREVTREKKVVFEHLGALVKHTQKQKDGTNKEVESRAEIYACQRLANGNTFIGECGSGRLLEVDPQDKIVKEIKLLKDGEFGGHGFMRNSRKLENGNYLVTHTGQGVVQEHDPDGKVVWEAKANTPHSTCRLPNGNTLIACGDSAPGARILEVDKSGKVVWEVKSQDLPNARLWFCTGLQRLPNGNTVITNWLGHGHFGQSPHIIEVTPDKKVVWTYSDHKTFKTISSIQLLDVPGDATKFELNH